MSIQNFSGPSMSAPSEWASPSSLKPYTGNARIHPKRQIETLKKLIRQFGFNNPILVDENNEIIAGHGRLIAANELKLDAVRIIRLSGLADREKKALRLADNKIALDAVWDMKLVKIELNEVSLDPAIDIELTGFSVEQADAIRMEGTSDPAEEAIPALSPKAISGRGDIWIAGEHRVGCGDAKDLAFVRALANGSLADAAFLDPPYNVRISGHAGGKGRIKHAEFVEASGEMSRSGFIAYLSTTLGACASISRNGAVHFVCIDHAHIEELAAAGAQVYGVRLNIAVWNKSNAGMGSLYRSKHELVFVYRTGDQPHRNNVHLGRHGRNRTNVWDYPSVNTFRGSRRQDLELHPTVKPTSMVADAIMDVTLPGETVLDAFLGSGTTLIAAERVQRRFIGLDIDPLYVDLALRRWRDLTGKEPVRVSDGATFASLEAEASQ